MFVCWDDLIWWSGMVVTVWWPDGCRVWGWSGLVLGFGGLIWRGSGWLLWSVCLVWWSTLEVCLRKMVWSEYWKLERWEAELIVVNGSIKEKRGSCTRKVGKKNRAQGSMGKNYHSYTTPTPPPPTSPASYSPERPFLSRLYCKTIFCTVLILIIFFISKSLLALVRRYGIT